MIFHLIEVVASGQPSVIHFKYWTLYVSSRHREVFVRVSGLPLQGHGVVATCLASRLIFLISGVVVALFVL